MDYVKVDCDGNPPCMWLVNLGWQTVDDKDGFTVGYRYGDRVTIDVDTAAKYYAEREQYPDGPPRF